MRRDEKCMFNILVDKTDVNEPRGTMVVNGRDLGREPSRSVFQRGPL